jgi:putative tryptophan/tyrosine transport system substrate-binding protein
MSPVALLVTLVLGLLSAPLTTEAQPPMKVPRIGYLSATSRAHAAMNAEAFRQGLRELGYVEGQTIAIEYRYADGTLERLPELAAELIRLPVDVLVTAGGNAAHAARHATSAIPIVVAASDDPVGAGLVASLARPGGNITGLSLLSPELGGKRLELLKEVAPHASQVAVLLNPTDPGNVRQWREMAVAARALGVQLQGLEVQGPAELERAFDAAIRQGAGALMILRTSLLDTHQPRIIHLAATSRLPSMYEQREFVAAGGLLSYGPSFPALFRRAAAYVDKILKGAKPGDLPVEQSTTFELVINLKTAQALGITIPPTLLFLADEVIR